MPIKRETHIIDASNKRLGRLAVEIAILLRGKDKPDFAPHRDMGSFVVVKNVEKLEVTGKKLKQKIYYRHSGYIGGLKKTPMAVIFKRNPGEVLKRAVWGMLPKNKLRAKMIKRLRIR